MRFKKGDIVIVPVPFTDSKGRKLRPALVISNETVHATGDIMVVQITSKAKNDGLSVIINNTDVTVSLPKESYVRCHKIFVIQADLIKLKASSLKKAKYKEVIAFITAIIS